MAGRIASALQAAVVKRMKMERPAPALRLAAVQQGMAKTVAGASVLVVATSHCTRTDIHQRCYRHTLRYSESLRTTKNSGRIDDND